MEGLADKFQWLRRRSGIFPEIKVFKYAPYDKRFLDEGDNFHLSSALRALESINIPDLLQESCPQLSSAAGACGTIFYGRGGILFARCLL